MPSENKIKTQTISQAHILDGYVYLSFQGCHNKGLVYGLEQDTDGLLVWKAGSQKPRCGQGHAPPLKVPSAAVGAALIHLS